MKYSFVLIFALFSQLALSQEILEWRAHTSFRSIIGIEQDSLARVWALTDGGIAVYENNSLVKRITKLDGLNRLRGTSISYDQASAKIFVGYIDGVIDVIDIEDYSIDRLEDIQRSTAFTSKIVNELLIVDAPPTVNVPDISVFASTFKLVVSI